MISGVVFWVIVIFIGYGLWQLHKDTPEAGSNPNEEIKYSRIK